MLRKTLFFFIYLSNCASVHWLKTEWILQQKFFSSSLEAHGWEVDTLAGFLWDPMHKNDLKSPPYFTYSSLTARKSEMINWNWDYQFNNSARITHEFWTFQQPARNLCFFYECWIDLAAGSWLTSRLKRNVQIYLHTCYTIPIPIEVLLCTLQHTTISLHYPGNFKVTFDHWIFHFMNSPSYFNYTTLLSCCHI